MSAWTNDPATTSTHIRALHINELRRAVNFYRQLYNLPAFNWTDGPWVQTTTHIRGIHFTELRAAIQDLWYAHVPPLGIVPFWTVNTTPSNLRQVSARDINDLRNWVNQVDPPLSIWTGFHWCSPVVASANPTAQTLLQQSGRLGTVLIADPGRSLSDFQDACSKAMSAIAQSGGGATLQQSILRLVFNAPGHPDFNDIGGGVGTVSGAEFWLESNNFFAYIDTFVQNGGINIVIFNELDNATEAQYQIDQRIMGCLSQGLKNHYGGGVFSLFPGPSGLESQGAFNSYWDRYDLRSGGAALTFGQYFGGSVDPVIADNTMLWHGGEGVFDRVGLHCYADNLASYSNPSTVNNPALQYLQWMHDTVDSTGWVYVTETNGTNPCTNANCDCGNFQDSAGASMAAFEANANAQFSLSGTFLQAIYGYILEQSDCEANSNGRHDIGTAFIQDYLDHKTFP